MCAGLFYIHWLFTHFVSNCLQFTQSAYPANTKSVKLHWLTYYITDCDFQGSSPLAEVWTICHMQKHFLCADANHWCSGAFLLNECFSKHIPISVLHRNVHLGMLNEYSHVQGFYKDRRHSRRSGAPFTLSVHQASPLPAGQYSGVERGEWCISNDGERV